MNFIKSQWSHDYKIIIWKSIQHIKKIVFSEKIIRTLKNRICKYVTSISKNVYIDKLADITNKYNNIYHRTFKMIPDDANSSTYIDFDTENNNLSLKLVIV